MVMRLNGLEAMRPRLDLTRKALADYQSGRHYAVVLVLLSVMDGFVNDFEPATRRGIHTRTPEEMDAWDSVVGHHIGLSSAHRSFTKTIKATRTEEVHDLHRHGLVHGTVVNFDNVFVSMRTPACCPSPNFTWRRRLAASGERCGRTHRGTSLQRQRRRTRVIGHALASGPSRGQKGTKPPGTRLLSGTGGLGSPSINWVAVDVQGRTHRNQRCLSLCVFALPFDLPRSRGWCFFPYTSRARPVPGPRGERDCTTCSGLPLVQADMRRYATTLRSL